MTEDEALEATLSLAPSYTANGVHGDASEVEAETETETDADAVGDQADLGRVLDIPVTVHVELGSRSLPIEEILRMGAGSLLELDAPAGSPLQVFANGTLIAQGEAVVVGEHYAVRITQVVSAGERIRRLGRSGAA